MVDKGTSVGLDISEDLLRVRLPYLDNELSAVPQPALQRSQSMLPSARFSYVTSRRHHQEYKQLDKPRTSQSEGKPTSQFGVTQKTNQDNSNDNAGRTEYLPALSASATKVLYDDRNMFLDGTPMTSKSTAQTPKQKSKPEENVATMYYISNMGLELYRKPNFSPLYRSRSEVQIMEQAKKMLTESGFEDKKLLKNDLEKLGKGISSLYMSDYGLHGERVAETSGMSLHKRLLPADHIEEEVQNIALKHIYMSQIPSLITRNSPARRSVTNFRKTMLPHGYSRKLQAFDRNDDPRRGRRNMTSPRKSMIMVSEKSTFNEHPLTKRTPFNSMENLSHMEKVQPLGIDIQGTLVSVHVTSKRIL